MSKNTIKNWFNYKKTKAATRATDVGVNGVESNFPEGLDLEGENLDEYEAEGIDDSSINSALGDDEEDGSFDRRGV